MGNTSVDWWALWVWHCAVCVCVCVSWRSGCHCISSVATEDKAVYRGGAGNDAGTTETCRGGVSAASCWSHHITFHTQPHNTKKKKKSARLSDYTLEPGQIHQNKKHPLRENDVWVHVLFTWLHRAVLMHLCVSAYICEDICSNITDSVSALSIMTPLGRRAE